MVQTYYRPSPGGTDLHAMAQAPHGSGTTSGIVIPNWYGAGAYKLVAGVLGVTPVSGVTASGYVGAATDGASGAFLLQQRDTLVRYSVSGTVNAYTASGAGQIFTGLTSITTTPWMVDASGRVFNLTAGVITQKGIFGSTPAESLAPSGASALVTMLASVSGIGTFNTGSFVTGVVSLAGVMDAPVALGTSGSLMAVGGWSNATMVSGFSSIQVDPAVSSVLAGVTPAAGVLSLWTTNTSGQWDYTTSASGAGTATGLCWAPNGNTVLTADPTGNAVNVFTYILGVLTKIATLTVNGATAIAFTTDSTRGLVCQPSLNQLTSLVVSGSGWATSGTVAIGAPKSAVGRSPSEIVIGCSSGLAFLEFGGGVWSIGTTTALSFNPTALALDETSGVVAAGALSTSGMVYWQGQTASYVGTVSGMAYVQGQILAVDGSNSAINVFGIVSGVLGQQGGFTAPPSPLAIAKDGPTLFAAASGVTWLYNLTAPYTLARGRNGKVGIYNGAAWSTATLGVGKVPTAVAFDGSGNVGVVASGNILYSLSTTGGVLSSGYLTVFSGQIAGTPYGVSSMMLFAGSLYGTSALNSSFVKLT